MKIMHNGSKLICIVCIHIECALTAICIKCAFSQSTCIGSLKANCIIMWNNAGVIYVFPCDWSYKEMNNMERINKCNVASPR